MFGTSLQRAVSIAAWFGLGTHLCIYGAVLLFAAKVLRIQGVDVMADSPSLAVLTVLLALAVLVSGLNYTFVFRSFQLGDDAHPFDVSKLNELLVPETRPFSAGTTLDEGFCTQSRAVHE